MITQTTLLSINNSQDIVASTKHATRMYLESCSIVNRDTSAENLWTIDQSILKEQLNTEIKGYFDFDFNDINLLKPSVLAARATAGLDRKPVFAKVLNDRYLERSITTTREGFYESRGIDLSEKVKKSIENISRILDENIDIETVRTRTNRIAQCIHNATNGLNFTNIDLDTIESLLIGLFGGNHSQAFFLFVDQISHIENLSAVIFSSVTLKICAKLSPLLAAKFLMRYNTDDKILGFIKEISNKIVFKQHSFIGRTKIFLTQHRREITYGFIGVAMGLHIMFYLCVIFQIITLDVFLDLYNK